MRETNKKTKKTGREVFSEQQIATVEHAIDATYPGVDFGPDFKGALFDKYPFLQEITARNPEVQKILEFLKEKGIDRGPLFFQPYLEKPLEQGEKVPPEVMIVALADLGGSGTEEAPAFFGEGDAEFRELYENVRQKSNLSRLLNGLEEKDKEDRTKVGAAMLGWLKSQPAFAVWQMLRFEKTAYLLETSGQLNQEQSGQLKNYFFRYGENIKKALERAENLSGEHERTKQESGEREAFAFLAEQMGYQK